MCGELCVAAGSAGYTCVPVLFAFFSPSTLCLVGCVQENSLNMPCAIFCCLLQSRDGMAEKMRAETAQCMCVVYSHHV